MRQKKEKKKRKEIKERLKKETCTESAGCISSPRLGFFFFFGVYDMAGRK